MNSRTSWRAAPGEFMKMPGECLPEALRSARWRRSDPEEARTWRIFEGSIAGKMDRGNAAIQVSLGIALH
jgi:hypothetical protein